MRTHPSFVPRTFVLASLVSAIAYGCGGDAKQTDSDADSGGDNGGTNGGSSAGGTASATGGDGSGGIGGTSASGAGGTNAGGTSAGTNAGGTNTGGGNEGGSSPMTGGTSSGGDAGTPSTGGASGSPSGGNGGSGAGTGGSGGAGKGSTGCSSQQVPTSGRFMIDVSGTMREYIVKLPADYDVTRPVPRRLIFAFHGRMYDAQSVADGGPPGSGPFYGIEAASGGSPIFVAPQALSTSWTNDGGRDVAYVNAMIQRFKAELCVDESRIFSVGFSMGAIMTLTYACANPTALRAIAPMSASLPSGCTGDTPIAYWGSHGTMDPTIPYASGQAVRDAFASRNGCEMATTPGAPDGCVNYRGCAATAPVTFCTFEGVHQPPPYAGEAIWAFVSQF